MKKLKVWALLVAVISLAITGCGEKKEEGNGIAGWYTMQSQVFTANGVESTIDHAEQRKVYTDEYYAFTNMREDTTSSFGFGYYTFDGKKLVEHNIFSTGFLDTAKSFDLLIEPHEAGYKQIIPEIVIAGVPNRLVEDYYKINFNGKSDMDGVWKLEEYINIANGDTMRSKRNQYKIFQSGYFMFVQSFVDPATNAPKKGFGFGDFKLEKDQIIETNVFCSYPSVRGVPIRINLTRDSEDSFTQTIVSDTNGSTSIEKYRRMPKIAKSTSNP
ncbi:MAG: hypothetical protein RL642_1362 [Bacteroidota bacterium]|jgi:hypothetical protein